MLTWLRRRRDRREKLREAARLEGEARGLRKSLASGLVRVVGAPTALGVSVLLAGIRFGAQDPGVRQAAEAVMDSLFAPAGDEARAAGLERRAGELRREGACNSVRP